MRGLTVKPKWRPSLAFVIALLCVLLVTLPVVVVLAVRLIDDQFIRTTEQSLQVQATLFAEAFATSFAAIEPEPDFGRPLDSLQLARRQRRFDPPTAQVDQSHYDLEPPFPDPFAFEGELGAPYLAIRNELRRLAVRARQRTFAGYLATDFEGRIVAASGSLSGSLAATKEIARALAGEDISSLRRRADQTERHPLSSISRNTAHRVFVAQPVVVGNRVVGAVLLSRTPASLENFLYEQSDTILRLVLAMAVGAAILGWIFWRFVSGPIRQLAAQSRAVAEQRQQVPEPLEHYGLRELADLGGNVLSMANSLKQRTRWLETYTDHVTHELKSPTTAIIGATELLQEAEPDMPAEKRARLLGAIRGQGDRINVLLERLRAVSQARLSRPGKSSCLKEVEARLASRFPSLVIDIEGNGDAAMPWSLEQAEIALAQLGNNAIEHGASTLVLRYDSLIAILCIRNDGAPIEAEDKGRVLEPFFTTKRDSGGTGMGLSIVEAIAMATGGQFEVDRETNGAGFRIVWPRAG